MTSPLVPPRPTICYTAPEWGRAGLFNLGQERATAHSHFNCALYLSRAGGHFDDMTSLALLLFSK